MPNSGSGQVFILIFFAVYTYVKHALPEVNAVWKELKVRKVAINFYCALAGYCHVRVGGCDCLRSHVACYYIYLDPSSSNLNYAKPHTDDIKFTGPRKSCGTFSETLATDIFVGVTGLETL